MTNQNTIVDNKGDAKHYPMENAIADAELFGYSRVWIEVDDSENGKPDLVEVEFLRDCTIADEGSIQQHDRVTAERLISKGICKIYAPPPPQPENIGIKPEQSQPENIGIKADNWVTVAHLGAVLSEERERLNAALNADCESISFKQIAEYGVRQFLDKNGKEINIDSLMTSTKEAKGKPSNKQREKIKKYIALNPMVRK